MAAQQLPGSLLVLIALPALGEPPLFCRAQYGKAARLLEVPVEIIAGPHGIQILIHRSLWRKTSAEHRTGQATSLGAVLELFRLGRKAASLIWAVRYAFTMPEQSLAKSAEPARA
jgi:hypothetical protein